MLSANLYLGRKKYPNRRWFKYSSKPLFTHTGRLRNSLKDIRVVGSGPTVNIQINLPFYADTVIEGRTIYPRKRKYLSIPMSPRLHGKTPMDYYGKGRFVKMTAMLPNRTPKFGLFFVVRGKPYFYMARKVTVPRRDLYEFDSGQIEKYLIPLLNKYTIEQLVPKIQGALANAV